MNFDRLNKMINYIEENLDKEIDSNELTKITKINLFILERIFMFLTNMTITEYTKRRRLSKAFEEIRNTNHRIIDIAFKYQYNSSTSFNRAFKRFFNITPTECRKGIGSYKITPLLYFDTNDKLYNFDYKIKKINSINLYCYHVESKTYQDLVYKIKELYNMIKNNDRYDEFNKHGMYGIFMYKNNTYHYYLGTTKYFDGLEEYQIKNNEYAEFKLLSREQSEIINFEKKLNNEWIPSTNYQVKDTLRIELYKDNDCYIYLPIK